MVSLFDKKIKKNNRDWPQKSGDNSFLGGSLLGQRWFLRMFDASSVFSHSNEDKSDPSLNKYGHWESVILYNTDTNLALSSIERPELSFDFGCWTRGGVIFGIWDPIGYNGQAKRPVNGWFSCQSALPLSELPFSLVRSPKSCDALDVENTLVTCFGVRRN